MARVLGLPDEELLELRRAAADDAGTVPARAPARDEGLGRPIGDWEPHDLEVHPSAARSPAGSARSVQALSGYVPRDHDEVLSEAVREGVKLPGYFCLLADRRVNGRLIKAQQGSNRWQPVLGGIALRRRQASPRSSPTTATSITPFAPLPRWWPLELEQKGKAMAILLVKKLRCVTPDDSLTDEIKLQQDGRQRWPDEGESFFSLSKDTEVSMFLQLPFTGQTVVSLFDDETFGQDDRLGSEPFSENEADTGEHARTFHGVHGSEYVMNYKVISIS
ncbi:hypothetical protein OG689_42695 [Kitasatospora sp. NBC_00240]|uniref:hypothetical protein n=1 Tax=Kitasatospora sp. NBC_00240 TaxID=2903567 RepID=UPI00225625A4|nr:hypothetical protein [Kitasatospora sp. NBC_00240]MCX5215858.1 hypothetical protein [Kitasatospora sp. NBC_00240]